MLLKAVNSTRPMPLYWLCYGHNNSIFVVIEPAHSLIHARLRASLDGLDEGEFTEGHELDGKWKVAKEVVGRRLSQAEAKRLLAKFECSKLGADAICNKNIWIEGKSLWIEGAGGSSQ